MCGDQCQPISHKGAQPIFVDRVVLSAEDQIGTGDAAADAQARARGQVQSRHGEKEGCELIVSQEDIPFNNSGISPYKVMNPHGFPSRMTVGKLIDLVSGKAGVLGGKFKYGTSSDGSPETEVSRSWLNMGSATVEGLPDVWDYGRTAGLVCVFRACVLPAAEAHGAGQDARAVARA